MQIVLLERVEKLGQMGDVVAVRDGYARNFLLPSGKALRANAANIARFETERAELEARNLERKSEADRVAADLNGRQFVVIRSASEAGALYGSVTSRDVAQIATEGGFAIDRSQVRLDRPVKELGLHPMKITLHPEVSAEIVVNAARSEEEARAQASGGRAAPPPSDGEGTAESEALGLVDVFDDDVEDALRDAPPNTDVVADDGGEDPRDFAPEDAGGADGEDAPRV